MPIEITEIFYPKTRASWRAWLKKHHDKKSEIWLQRYKKASGKPTLTYEALVEECLCYGWIDGTIKRLDEESNVQRITPRRKKKTFLSELNRQRVWKLQRLRLMTDAGIAPIAEQIGSPDDPFEIPEFILSALQAEEEVWTNFQEFPHLYQRLKVGWISAIRPSPQQMPEAQKRLNYLIKNTRIGKMYGTIPDVLG